MGSVTCWPMTSSSTRSYLQCADQGGGRGALPDAVAAFPDLASTSKTSCQRRQDRRRVRLTGNPPGRLDGPPPDGQARTTCLHRHHRSPRTGMQREHWVCWTAMRMMQQLARFRRSTGIARKPGSSVSAPGESAVRGCDTPHAIIAARLRAVTLGSHYGDRILPHEPNPWAKPDGLRV